MNFTEDKIKKLADLLLIGLTDEETKMVLDEFDIIDKNINKINEIENISEIEPMTHALDNFCYELRSDKVEESCTLEELLSNSDNNDGAAVVLPKVVG